MVDYEDVNGRIKIAEIKVEQATQVAEDANKRATYGRLVSAAQGTKNPIYFYELGKKYNEEGQSVLAIKAFKNSYYANQQCPYPPASVVMGKLYETKKDYDKSKKLYEIAFSKEMMDYYIKNIDLETDLADIVDKREVLEDVNNAKKEACFLIGYLYERNLIKKEKAAAFKAEKWYKKAAELGYLEAYERLDAIEKKKNINIVVRELNSDKITEEHSRAKWWYYICIVLFICFLGSFGYYMYWNVQSVKGCQWEEIIVRVIISLSFLSMIFILMNQAARSRKNMVLLSKEIQEYKYIGALLKGKVDMSTDSLETNKEINEALSKMIQLHLDIQKQRLEKEDHSEVKDITPDVLNFFKDNTSTMMGNFNEMQKNILDLHKTIVQTLKDNKGDGK